MILVAAVAALGGVAAASPAAMADVGTEDFGYAPLTDSPTGNKPQSKLWYADGQWWATLFDAAAGQHRIYRLDRASQDWDETGTAIDPRRSTRADVLFDEGGGFVPTARDRPLNEVGGWGLHLVNELADRWGVATEASHVWFEIARGESRSKSMAA